MESSSENPLPDIILVEGPKVLLAMACQECRMVMFSRSPMESVTLGLGHAQECGSSRITVAELVTAKDLPVDIEERAERWVDDHLPEKGEPFDVKDLIDFGIDAYLAGVNQARADEEAHRRYESDNALGVRLGPPGVGQ